MARLTYKGDHAAVFVVVDGAASIEATKGEPVDVPDALVDDLLASEVWVASDDKAAKPAKGKAAKQQDDDTATSAEKEG